MNGLPYYKAYPRDFIEGTIGMPFELKGAYRLVLDLIYMQGGNLPDDARYISGLLGCTVRKWNSLRDQLVEMDKIQVNGECLTNYRAVIELETLAKLQDKQRENGSQPKKNKDLAKPPLNHTEPEPEPYREEDTNVSLYVSPANDTADAVRIYNDAAAQAGWPSVQKLTPARSKAIRARMSDAGGIEGWKIAIEKASASDFLCGNTSNAWSGFGFDWITKQANFTKLMEGNYDNRSNNPRTNSPHSKQPGFGSGTVDAFAAVAAQYAEREGRGGGSGGGSY